VPAGGIPENGDKVQIELTNGDKLTTDMVIMATGQKPNTGSHKAARPGAQQAGVVARNIVSMIENGQAAEEFKPTPAAIHLSLGIVSHCISISKNLSEANECIETKCDLP
jgi:hypothetical protein